MKTLKNQLLLFTIISFVILFYSQDMGVNLSIFSLIVWGTLLFLRRGIYKNVRFVRLSVSIFISAAAFAWYGDFISFAALYISLIITGFYTLFLNRLNILNLILLVPVNYASFIIRIFWLDKWLPNKNKMTNTRAKLFAYYLIPGFFVVLFLIVYSNSSTVLSEFFRNFTIGFNILEVIILSGLGFFFMFNFYHLLVPKFIIQNNKHLGDTFSVQQQTCMKPTFHNMDINLERKSGEITLILLNTLLAVFLIIYNAEQFQLNNNDTLSSNVHERIYTIIFSIILAVSVILLYFKNTLNFHGSNKRLKRLTYLWILLNLALIVSAIAANTTYIHFYSLTFKRIGVYIFLMVCIIGLYFTYNKIRQKKTNIYLIKNMFWTFFVTLVISSVVNWSWIVTKYTLNHSKNPDLYYLFYETRFNREIFYKNYKDEFMRGWQGQTDDETYKVPIERGVAYERNKKFLSRKLYYQFVELK